MAIIERNIEPTPRRSLIQIAEQDRVQFGFRSRHGQLCLPEPASTPEKAMMNWEKVRRRNTWGTLEDVYNRLQALVNYHRYMFYIKNSPIVEDFEYDEMRAELEDFERCYPHLVAKWSPTQTGPSDDERDYPASLVYLANRGQQFMRRPAYEWA